MAVDKDNGRVLLYEPVSDACMQDEIKSQLPRLLMFLEALLKQCEVHTAPPVLRASWPIQDFGCAPRLLPRLHLPHRRPTIKHINPPKPKSEETPPVLGTL